MTLRATVAGLTYEAENLKAVGEHFRMFCRNARERSMACRTIKEARYYEGRAYAYEHVADLLENMEEVK